MEFRLLGPLEVVDAGRVLVLGGRRQRAVLVHLLLSAGVPMSADLLVDRVWADSAPEHVRASVHSYVSRLRHLLGARRLETRGSSYLLHADPGEVDLRRFEQLLASASALTEHDPRAAADTCDRALSLWRGSALGDLSDEPSLHPTAERLQALHDTAVQRRLDARLLCGDHADLIPELADLVAGAPLREDLWARYVLALYRCGRPAEAVATCDHARRLLDRELGVTPGHALRTLQEQVLRQDPGLLLHGRELHGYRLGEVLGHGPSSIVHRGVHAWLGQPVAVKALHPAVADDPRVVHGFAAAVHAAAAVEHPHVLTLHDAWREPGEAVLVLRLATGGTLAEALRRQPPGRPDLLALAGPLASALDACARQGVLHTDLGPEHVLLDHQGRPLLSPFVLTRSAAPAGHLPGRPDVGALAALLLGLARTWAPAALRDLLLTAVRGDAGLREARPLVVAMARAVQRSSRAVQPTSSAEEQAAPGGSTFRSPP